MLPLFEFFIITFDYFFFLLEPLISKLSIIRKLRAILRRNNVEGRLRLGLSSSSGSPCPTKPWLELVAQQVEPTLEGLSAEIEAFQEWSAKTTSDGRDYQMLERVRDIVSLKWSWISFHLAPLDPIHCNLEWLDYDLCLIDDWDLAQLAPSLNIILEAEGNGMRVIHSSSSSSSGALDRKLLLEITTTMDSERDTVDQQTRHSGPEFLTRQMLSVKWLTNEQFELLEKRSTLIFYYTQIHPELKALYTTLVALLSGANLLATDFHSDLPAESEITRADSDFTPLVEAAAKGRYSGSAGSDKQILDRYTLLLMLVAYLESNESERANGSNKLAHALIGFLSAYTKSVKSGGCIYIRPTGPRRVRLELVYEEARTGAARKLVVWDPIARPGGGKLIERGPDIKRHRNERSDFHNLTENITPEKLCALQDFFAGLRSHLGANIKAQRASGGDANKPASSLLSAMFTFCGFKADLARSDKPLFPPRSGDAKPTGGFARLTPRRVLTNLFILAAILLLRAILINYLEQLKAGLQEQARDDMIQLKRSLFDDHQPEDDYLDETKFARSLPEYDEALVYDSIIGEDGEEESDMTAGSESGEAGANEALEAQQLLSQITNILLMKALGSSGLPNGAINMEELMRALAGAEGLGADENGADAEAEMDEAELENLFKGLGLDINSPDGFGANAAAEIEQEL